MNPGGLYGNARPENFPNINDYRNPIVAAAFKTLGYVNMFNRGVREVQRQLEENGNPPAIFNVSRLTAFEVIIHNSLKASETKSRGTSRRGTSRVTSQDVLSQGVPSRTDISQCKSGLYNMCSSVPSQSVPSRGVPSQDVPSHEGGFEIVTKGILRYCSQPKNLKEIAEYLGIKAFKRVKTRYVDHLLEQGKLAMTVPDKPRSRFQKYVATGKISDKK